MKDKGISCGIHYESLHNHPVYFKQNSNCPLSEVESVNTVSIPFHEELTNHDIKYIINSIKEWKSK
jgi:dTDP-4-amino-4,6-dideoxygalactose transaminase